MMGTFLLALVVVMLLIAGMSIGVIMGRKPISGTCGGINNMGEKGACEICGGNPQKCEESSESSSYSSADLGYDATKD